MRNYYSHNRHCSCGKLITNNAITCCKCNKLGEGNPNYKEIIFYCRDCGKEVYSNSKRCKICYNKWNKISENNNRYIDGKSLEDVFCIDCGKKVSDYRVQRCRSCGTKKAIQEHGHPLKGKHHTEETKNKIRAKAKIRLSSPQANPNWIDGRSFELYSILFTDKLKEQIRERDNFTCQNCEITEEEHLIVFGSVLSIHHIDYNKQNCEEDNLITLCNSCNVRANYNRDYWKKVYKNKDIVSMCG